MIKTKIKNFLKKTIKENIEIEVFVSENEQFGHYSTNVALKLAKIKKENPMEIAENLKSQISHAYRQAGNLKSDFFKKIEIAPPGFINFWISEKVLQDEIKEILKQKEKYGAGKKQKEKIQIEFI